jgi:hypothetical protein
MPRRVHPAPPPRSAPGHNDLTPLARFSCRRVGTRAPLPLRAGGMTQLRYCWWKSGPKGGRRHNSPLGLLSPFACLYVATASTGVRNGNAKLNKTVKETKKILNRPKTERPCGCLRRSLPITVCPFHYKGFTICRRPLDIVICLNYTFSVPDKPL